MPSRRHLLELGVKLPPGRASRRGEPPQLGPFNAAEGDIHFLELLSDHERSEPVSDDSAISGGHSFVFKVRIGSSIFALKIFKNWEIRKDTPEGDALEDKIASENTIKYHSDPFFAECRAYGKLNAKAETKKLAVPCYGYLILHFDTYAPLLRDRFLISGWDNETAREGKKAPLRALVKEYIEGEAFGDLENNGKVPEKTRKRMKQDLQNLKEIGILPRDIKYPNYREGSLIDFSMAWTKPHWDPRSQTEAGWQEEWEHQIFQFDEMFDSFEGQPTLPKNRAGRNHRVLNTLRAYSHPTDIIPGLKYIRRRRTNKQKSKRRV